ncbi:MAG: hypothetical protein EA351_10765, partial [Gemmatimonadales bacterium]
EALPGDEWILGQRVRYLIEANDLIGARQVLQDCEAREHWCAALAGWVFHEDDDWVRAGDAFLTLLETLPRGEEDRWTGERYLLERDGRSFLDVSDPEERMRRRALLWRLSDPLFMVPGNARWTAHMARLTQVRTLEDAWNPFGLPWDVDLEEILLRYGWALGWERQQGGPGNMQQLSRNRMTARLDPDRRRYLPTGEELVRFPVGDDGDLRVQTGRQPVGFTPAYAPTFLNLQSQTARFLREGEMYIVHSFARLPADAEGTRAQGTPSRSDDPFGAYAPAEALEGPDLPRDLRTALYLLPVDGPVIEEGLIPVQEGVELEGVWTAQLDRRADHILSLEGWSRVEGRAWRTRRALPALEVPAGRVSLSDPVFFTVSDELPPESLAEALDQVRPSLRFPPGETMRVGWEVYGLDEGDIASVSIGVERADRSLLRAIGEFFRVIETPEPVTIRWDDAPDDDAGIVFRALDLSIGELDAGNYDLFIEVGLPGEEPAVARRRLVVEGS